jgi:general secretion pathway protein A
MFLNFYGLREEPFGVTPDPRFLYLSPAHREALASLYYGIEAGRGFMAVIAKPGMGKTTLLFHLLQQLQPTAQTAFLFQTQCDSREFIRFLLQELGIELDGKQDMVGLHDKFNRCLLQAAQARRRVVVVIDEAQNLEPSVLETVRLLSDFETPQAKLLQIVLSGQPELADKLARPSLRQLRQRISVLCTIAPLQPEEVDGYIKRRLEAAGRREPLFSPGAVRAIAEMSEGIPRNINNICFNALSLGCASRVPTIDVSIVQQVKADFDLDALRSDPGAESPETISLPDAGVDSSDFGFAGWSVDHPQVRTHDALTPNRALAYLQEIVQQLQKKEKKKKSLAN